MPAPSRVLMETTLAIAFIFQNKSKQRMMIYYAHGIVQSIRMLNEWAQMKGLKRMAPKAMLVNANAGLASYLAKLLPGTDAKRHWSGTASLQAAMKKLSLVSRICG